MNANWKIHAGLLMTVGRFGPRTAGRRRKRNNEREKPLKDVGSQPVQDARADRKRAAESVPANAGSVRKIQPEPRPRGQSDVCLLMIGNVNSAIPRIAVPTVVAFG